MDLDQIALDAATAINELAPKAHYGPARWKALVQLAVLEALKRVTSPHFVMRSCPGATVERIWVDGQEYVLKSSTPDPASVPHMVQEFARRLGGTAAHWKAQGRHTCELGVMPIPEAEQLAAALRGAASAQILEAPGTLPAGAMPPEEAANRMREIAGSGNPESGHIEADGLVVEILRRAGYGEAAQIFDDMMKWYG